ncbi:hypothetical protein JTE90_011932 [Oedothorax gibbosus]|uniref:Ribosomal biogenesis protein LAS1L n=1 Tax=Oedothorax gibbosus TaxID=931172 RepID=A0AAV6V2W3_9ARAC|nr:hypothetical protein JTE90_011932 [Oedothorax gibbosus]
MDENEELPMELSTPNEGILKQKGYKTVVPWRYADNFRKVYECLYSPSTNDKIWATNEIAVWETRCQYALAAAIEATYVLVRAVLQDMLAEDNKCYTSERDLQNLFAMAIVRFVNLMLEREGKDKNLTVLADKYQIPRWIVELRHDATHAKVPSLPLLRMGARLALQYLEDNYWKLEVDRVRPIVKPMKNLEVYLSLLKQFKSHQFQVFSINKQGKDASKIEMNRTAVLNNIRSLVMKNKPKFVEALVTPGIFLSENEILELEEGKAKIYVKNGGDLQMPDTFIKFWLPIFRILHKYDLILTFLEMLLLSLEQIPSTVCHSTAAAVVVHIIRSTLPNSPNTDLRLRFKAHGVLLDSSRLLYASMRAANLSTGHVFEEIVQSYHGGDSELCNDLCLVVCPRLGMIKSKGRQVPAELKGEDPIFFTVADLEEDSNKEIEERTTALVENKWSMAPLSIDFSEMPLGHIINPVCPQATGEEMEVEEVEIIDENDSGDDQNEQGNDPEIDRLFQDPDIGDMIYRR